MPNKDKKEINKGLRIERNIGIKTIRDNKMIYRLQLYPNHEIAKREYQRVKSILGNTDKQYINPELIIIQPNIKIQYRGIHDLERFLRGRLIDKVISYTHLSNSQEMAIQERLILSKETRPLEYNI
jgi:hypothetical protein